MICYVGDDLLNTNEKEMYKLRYWRLLKIDGEENWEI